MFELAGGVMVGKRADGGVNISVADTTNDCAPLLAEIVVTPEQWQAGLDYLAMQDTYTPTPGQPGDVDAEAAKDKNPEDGKESGDKEDNRTDEEKDLDNAE